MPTWLQENTWLWGCGYLISLPFKGNNLFNVSEVTSAGDTQMWHMSLM